MAPKKGDNFENKSAFSIYKKKPKRGKIKKNEKITKIVKKSQAGSSECKDLTNGSDLFKQKNGKHLSSIEFQKNLLKQKNVKQKNAKSNEGKIKKMGKISQIVRKSPAAIRENKRYWESFSSLESKETIEENSVEEGKKMFEWLLYPLTYEAFLQDIWEKRVYHAQHHNKEYYSSVLSLQMIDQILRKHNVKFSKNIDITSYTNGERQTHNPLGRATPDKVWEFFEQGCSVRLLNPQTFIPQVGMVVSILQELFQCMVGANVYLTPQNSQGFAPHYDDIDAFVLQIEGSKHWRVYEPRSSTDELPRFSSKNFNEEDIDEPVLDVVLKAGDVLYFPRGFIHQAKALNEHSLHITISCNQQNSWGDLMEKMIPVALKMAMDDEVEFRKGLPPGYLNYVGSSHSDLADHPEREAFYAKLHSLFDKLWDHLPVDASADQMAKNFMHNAYPPVLSAGEFEKTSLHKQMKISLNSNIKLLRANILRIVMEEHDEDTITVYHYADNSKEYHGDDQQYFEIPINHALGVEHLVNSYPKYIAVNELPLESNEEKIDLASDLWQRGLLLASKL